MCRHLSLVLIKSLKADNCLHFARFRTFFTGFRTRFAAIGVVGVFTTFFSTSVTAFHAQSAQFIRELRISGTQTGAKGANVRTIPTDFNARFMSCHRGTHGATFFTFNHASQARINAVFHILHNRKNLSCELIFTLQRCWLN